MSDAADPVGADDTGGAEGRVRRVGRMVVLGALTAAAPLSLDTYLPALPRLTADLGTATSLAQLSLTTCLVGLALGQLVAGPLSDVLGRRRPMLVGAAGFATVSLACAFAPNVATLVVLRLLQGLLGAVGIVIARAVVRDRTTGERAARSFATLMLISGVAPIVAPVLGGQVLRLTSWRGIFVALAVFAAAVGVAVLLAVPETLPPESRRGGGWADTRASFGVLLADRKVVACVSAAGLAFSAMFAYIAGSTYVLQGLYGLSPQGFSGVFTINALGIVSSVQLAGRLVGAGRVRAARMLAIALSTAVVGSLGLLVAALAGAGLVGVVAGLFVTVSGVGMSLPTATTLALADHPEQAGAASALVGTSQFLVGALVAPLIGVIGVGSAVPMAAVMVAATAAALVVYTLLWRSARPGAPS